MTPILARFEGVQEFPGQAPFALWTIMEPIAGHPIHSTLSINTLQALGFVPVPTEGDV